MDKGHFHIIFSLNKFQFSFQNKFWFLLQNSIVHSSSLKVLIIDMFSLWFALFLANLCLQKNMLCVLLLN